jgi:hypothetical protein
MALGSAANVAASNAAMGLGGSAIGASAPAAGSAFGAFSAGAAPAAGSALTPAAAMAVPGSAQAIYAAQTASNASGAVNPFKVGMREAMMVNQAMGGFGQQQPQGGQQTSVGIRQGQPVNTADPIAALLAPKRKKKEPISLL